MRWHGSGSVRFSVRSTSGRWGPWLDAAAEEEDQPDAGSPEAAREPRLADRQPHLGRARRTGSAIGSRARSRDLRASFVRSPELRIPLRAVASAGSPPIVPRSAWGADESIRRDAPPYAPAIRFASVHHTAGTNDYSPAQAAAIMRGIEIYHVKSNGWNDIGYNFLVDRYGTVYEGRYGGIDKNVIGAYARGFNTGSVGVAVIGTFGTSPIPAAAEASLEKLLAWRLDLAHVDPVSSLTFVSGGSERYRAGVPVVLARRLGAPRHGPDPCPGDLLYAKLDAIAAKAEAIGLPKLYEPKVTGAVGGTVRFQARVSSALPWKVTRHRQPRAAARAGTGQGPIVDYSWDASLATATGARWRIEVAGATPVTGTLGKATPSPARSRSPTSPPTPPTISPNGDGVADTATITYTTNAAATVTATLLDATGAQLAEIGAPRRASPAGEHTLTFDGLGQPDGVYTIVLTAVDATGISVTQPGADRDHADARGPCALAPAVLTPNGDGIGDELTVTLPARGARHRAPARAARRQVGRDAVRRPLAAGPQSLPWDGASGVGRTRDGSYRPSSRRRTRSGRRSSPCRSCSTRIRP